jgi:starch synthase (maltosyl-transferring)
MPKMNLTPATESKASMGCKRIYYVNPLLLVGRESWDEIFDHACGMGFDSILSAPPFERRRDGGLYSTGNYERLDPALELAGPVEEALSALVQAAQTRGLGLMLDLVIQSAVPLASVPSPVLDPRPSPLLPRTGPAIDANELTEQWQGRLARLAGCGIAGYRVLGLDTLSPGGWKCLIAAARKAKLDTTFFAYTPGTDFPLRTALHGCGFSGCFSSIAWWDLREDWLLEEFRLQRALGEQIAFPEAPFGKRLARGNENREVLQRKSLRAVRLCAEFTDRLLVPMGFEFGARLPLDPMLALGHGLPTLRAEAAFDLCSQILDLNKRRSDGDAARLCRSISASSQVTIIGQADQADLRTAGHARLVAINRDLRRPATLPESVIHRTCLPFVPTGSQDFGRLQPGEVRIFQTALPPMIVTATSAPSLDEATTLPRIAIENVTPAVDDGRFPVRRVIGDTMTVEADIFADGHDPLTASLLYRAAGSSQWKEVRMALSHNDRWTGAFRLDQVGRFEFCIEAWKNQFAIFRYELGKKYEARLNLHLEVMEGKGILQEAAANPAEAMIAEDRRTLSALLAQFETKDEAGKLEILLAARTGELMALADRRPFRVRSCAYRIESERPEAAFASWYQIFPRSQSGDLHRHGTFDDVIDRLPSIREMGFDVLYFPPIHPIGKTNRKGRNNALAAAPGDPGSPYAIGSDAGGHDAIHPELGQFDDFERLVSEARRYGLELALDLAIQASPDHPWLTEHPGWFDWRADGSIRYAENPPKKYEDIVNVDFYTKDALPALWEELRDIVELWIDEGVKLFRVDNPHTKPFPFWEWMIAQIRSKHPDVVFLSEAFTRPKVMYRLAKVGFSQSYTYFTWRNSRRELEQYLTELSEDAPREFFRPHFFVNTHDINPDFLQNAPRPAFLIRAALASTLSGLWGVYNGFELCEGRPDAKRKEYADSEKYEIRAWDYDRPGNIKAEIAMLNRIRRDNAALHSHLGLTLLPSTNPNVMFFEKASANRDNVLFIAVTMNPDAIEESSVEFPLWRFGKSDEGTLAFDDLVSGENFNRTGKWQTIRLDPARLPFAIWRVRAGEV